MSDENVLYRRVVSAGGRVSYVEDGKRWDGDAWPLGWHIVGVKAGERTVLFNVNPDRAGTLSALREHQPAVLAAVERVMLGRPVPDTARARKAYEAYRAAGGCDDDAWLRGSAMDVFDAIAHSLEKSMHSDRE
jgi:hypothetical protein